MLDAQHGSERCCEEGHPAYCGRQEWEDIVPAEGAEEEIQVRPGGVKLKLDFGPFIYIGFRFSPRVPYAVTLSLLLMATPTAAASVSVSVGEPVMVDATAIESPATTSPAVTLPAATPPVAAAATSTIGTTMTVATTTSATNCGLPGLPLKVLNAVGFAVTLALNFVSSTGVISPYGVGTVSRQHPTVITPAGGAFAIWAYIYSLQGFFVAFQFCWPAQDRATLLHGVGFWYLATCFFNSLWIVVFVQGTDAAMWCSTAIIACLLASICKIHVNTKCWSPNRSRGLLQTIALDVHLSMYAGWVTVATIVNISVALSTAWKPDAGTASVLAVILLLVALALNVIIMVRRRDLVWGWVLCWASHFIAVANEDNHAVRVTAIVVSVLIGLISAVAAAVSLFFAFRRQHRRHGGTGLEQNRHPAGPPSRGKAFYQFLLGGPSQNGTGEERNTKKVEPATQGEETSRDESVSSVEATTAVQQATEPPTKEESC